MQRSWKFSHADLADESQSEDLALVVTTRTGAVRRASEMTETLGRKVYVEPDED